MSNTIFGRLTVTKSGSRNGYVVAICQCGTTKEYNLYNLRSGTTKSCGCLRRESRKLLVIDPFPPNTVVGRLTILEKLETTPIKYRCLCSCGSYTTVNKVSLSSGNTQSCGCLRVETHTSHGMRNSPEYSVWRNILNRCRPTDKKHADYFDRGITVCQEWTTSFEAFYRDMGNKPEGLTIDRINNDLGYSKENCRWANMYVQSRNQRTVNSKGLRKGVKRLRTGKWEAYIKVVGVFHYLGTFVDYSEAVEAREKAEAKHYGLVTRPREVVIQYLDEGGVISCVPLEDLVQFVT